MSSPIQISLRVRSNRIAQMWDEFYNELNTSSIDLLRMTAENIVNDVAAYPEPFKAEPGHEWASEKQRLYVMWAISKGKMVVPRPREGEYGMSWFVEKYKSGFRIRSNYPAAKYVAGTATDPSKQALIHQDRWRSLRLATEVAVADLPDDMRDNILLAARRSGLK